MSITKPLINTIILGISLMLIAMLATPLQNTFVTLTFFVLFGFFSYNFIKIFWWLLTRKKSPFGNRLFVVLAVELTVAVMLNSASRLSISDVAVMILIGIGVLMYMRWRFARY